ncbi:MAG: hypothetical protein AAB502_11945 [Chloroflexota bacterium]
MRIGAGIFGGLIAGVVFGVMMAMMSAPTPTGGSMPMIQMVAAVVKSDSVAVGWIYHLFNSAVIGLGFALVLSSRAQSVVSGVLWGAIYGVAWWMIGGLIIMPVALGLPAFAPLTMPMMLPVAMGSLMGHMIYGVILGVAYVVLTRNHRQTIAASAR